MRKLYFISLCLLTFALAGCKTPSFDTYKPENNGYVYNALAKDVRIVFEYERVGENGALVVSEVPLPAEKEQVFTIGGESMTDSVVKTIYVVNHKSDNLYAATGNPATVFPESVEVSKKNLEKYMKGKGLLRTIRIADVRKNAPAITKEKNEAHYLVLMPQEMRQVDRKTYTDTYRK